MKKHFFSRAGALALALTALTGITALAGEWKQDAIGYWWQDDDGSYPVSCWRWLDGNGDGISECYYFNQNGYMASNAVIDGWQVNSGGAWVENGVTQVRESWEHVKDSDDPMEILRAATERNADTTSMDMDYYMNMRMELGGEEPVDINMNGNMKVRDAASERMEYVMEVSMELLGESVRTDAFYTDGWYYYQTDGQKIKMEMSSADALNNAQIAQISAQSDDLSYIRDVSMVRNEDEITVYYTADGTELMDEVEKVLSATGYSMEDMGLTMTIDQYKGEFTIDDAGNISQERVLMDFNYGLGTDTMKLHMYMEADINATGDAVTFTIPSTEGYVDFYEYLNQALAEAVAENGAQAS